MKRILIYKLGVILLISISFRCSVSKKSFTHYQEEVNICLSQIKQKIDDITKKQSAIVDSVNAIKKQQTVDKKNIADLENKIVQTKEQIVKLENDTKSVKEQLRTFNNEKTVIKTDYDVINQIDYGTDYLSQWSSVPMIMTAIEQDGSVNVCCVDKELQQTYIYKYSKEMKHLKTLTIVNELKKTGAFAVDNDGNYYLFYAKDVEEGAVDEESMMLVKYSNEGEIINKFSYKAQITSSFFSSVKIPFDAGNCRIEISGNLIAVYFAREMFKAEDGRNHQASYGFILDINSFALLSNGGTGHTSQSYLSIPYVSHSFNQFILPIEDGFLMADHGDGFPRSFHFAKVQKTATTKTISAFQFKSGTQHYNFTFAQLGGIVSDNDEYIFAGTYEKNSLADNAHNDSRNLFILKIDKNLDNCSPPIWITNYMDKDLQNAGNPKIVKLYKKRYLLIWECFDKNSYTTTYFTIIDSNGNKLKPITAIPNIRLNINDVLRYNVATGTVNWAVNDGKRTIIIYSFNPDNY